MTQSNFGVVLVNLGTPEAPTPRAVRKFLRAFLSDPAVVDLPSIPWQILLNGIILPLRSGKVARAYQGIWLEQGSPLQVHTRALANGLSMAMKDQATEGTPAITWAMTYGKPSINNRIDELVGQGVSKILIVPLYPQFSYTTTGVVIDAITAITAENTDLPDIQCAQAYYGHPLYIEALADSVRDHWQRTGRQEKLLMSFHGLPERNAVKGDPYIDQCKTTAKLLSENLQLSAEQWGYSFQSRFGPAAWVKPFTNEVLTDWARNNISDIDVICPSFSVDCLETLDEIGMQYDHVFKQAGGKTMSLIACLNDARSHIRLMGELIREYGW